MSNALTCFGSVTCQGSKTQRSLWPVFSYLKCTWCTWCSLNKQLQTISLYFKALLNGSRHYQQATAAATYGVIWGDVMSGHIGTYTRTIWCYQACARAKTVQKWIFLFTIHVHNAHRKRIIRIRYAHKKIRMANTNSTLRPLCWPVPEKTSKYN